MEVDLDGSYINTRIRECFVVEESIKLTIELVVEEGVSHVLRNEL